MEVLDGALSAMAWQARCAVLQQSAGGIGRCSDVDILLGLSGDQNHTQPAGCDDVGTAVHTRFAENRCGTA